MALKWVFLDVGNVLLDEDPLTYLSFRRHAEAVCQVRTDWTFFDVLAARETLAASGSRWPLYEAIVPILGDEGCQSVWASTAIEVRARFAELSPPIPGAGELLKQLSGDGYRLGVIANQGKEARERLKQLGWLDRFEILALSEEVGAFKPDLALFRHALQLAGAKSGECLMVGDRLDNDIAPAAALGMLTAWVRWPDRTAKGWRPIEPEAIAYMESLERLAPREPGKPEPDSIVDEIAGLDEALGNWRREERIKGIVT